MAADPKRQRRELIQSAMDLSGLSNRVLHQILQKTQGEKISWKTMVALRHERFNAVKDELDLQVADGEGRVRLPVANPNRLLEFTASECGGFRAVLEAAYAKHPCSRERPWNLLIGFDEYVPGDKLNVQNARKAMNLIFSFEELGASGLILIMEYTSVSVKRSLFSGVLYCFIRISSTQVLLPSRVRRSG